MNSDQSVLRIDNLAIHPDTQRVTVNEAVVKLTQNEYLMLEILVRQRGLVVSRYTLMSRLYGKDPDRDEGIVDIFIHKLCKKLALAGAANLIVKSWAGFHGS